MKQAKQYFSKMLMLLPLTFLVTPLFYSLLGYHPEVRFFKLLVYIWYVMFVYLGMTLSLIMKRYPYLPYPIFIIISFLCKNICEIPALGMMKNLMYMMNTNSTDGTFEMVMGSKMLPDDFVYLSLVVFATSFFAGFLGAIYAKKPALEFVNKGNTLIFVHLCVISAVWYMISGIGEIDKNAIGMFIIYMVCLTISYFLVRNFAHLNRQLEVYAENGVYNVSGTKRIYAYYFSSLIALMLSLPLLVLIGSLILPYIANGAGYISAALVSLITKVPNPLQELTPTEEGIPKGYTFTNL